MAIRFYGRRRAVQGIRVDLAAMGAAVSGITVEIRRGKTLFARTKPVRVAAERRQVVLRRRRQRRFPLGDYTLVVRRNGREIQRRRVRLGK